MTDDRKLMNFTISVRTHSILKEFCDRNHMTMTSVINKMILDFIDQEKDSVIHNNEPLDFFILR